MELVSSKKRNIAIDVYKLLLALFVVFIHCGPFIKWDFMFSAIRIAVPGFLIISGFFFFKNGISSDEEMAKRALRFFLMSVKYMFIGIATALLLEVIIMGFILHYSIANMFVKWFSGDLFRNLFLDNYPPNGQYTYHLWYLIAISFSYLIIFILYKLKLGKVVKFLPVLFIGLFFFSIWLKFIPNQGNLVSRFKTRNAYFMALPGITLGFDLAHLKKYKFHWAITLGIGLLGIGFFVLQHFEGKAYGVDFEITISSILAASCFVVALDRIPLNGGKIYNLIVGKNMSFFMYVYHVCVFKCINYFFKIDIHNHLAIISFFATLALYFVAHWIYIGIKFGYIKLSNYIQKRKLNNNVR